MNFKVISTIATIALLSIAGCSSTPAPVATTPISISEAPATITPIVNPSSSPGVVLPNATRTPGEVNTSVTQSNISQTVCVSGWTATIRPPAAYTTQLKIKQLASGYAYNSDTFTRDYEEDHLISLELGGSPTAEKNLWPEPYAGTQGARAKDRVENKLRALVCNHTITLVTAQHAIATNWWTAYQTYIGG